MPWNPEQYLKFASERFQPFNDLAKLLQVRSGLKAVDLGCGSGELTVRLAELLPGCEILGIDNSAEMLERVAADSKSGLRYCLQSIEDFLAKYEPSEYGYDLIFSNAALHWIADHQRVIPNLFCRLRSGGQLLLQFPSGHRNPAHRLMAALTKEEPYLSALKGWVWQFPVLPIEAYAELLVDQGAMDIEVFDKVYPHVLPDADAVYEFTSGTTLLPYLERLPEWLRESFRVEYRKRLWQRWSSGKVFFGFRRILISATRP